MYKDKQIEEMAKIICGSHNNGACVFNHEPCDLNCSANGEAIKLYDSGYRKASEVITEIDNALHDMAMEYHAAGHPEYFAVCEMVHHKVITPIEKKYTEGRKTNEI